MQIPSRPRSLLGKWAVGLGIALVVLIACELVFAFAVGGNADMIDSNPTLLFLANFLSISFTIIAPASLIMGIVAFIKHKEREVLQSLAFAYLLVVVLFILGEFLFPH